MWVLVKAIMFVVGERKTTILYFAESGKLVCQYEIPFKEDYELDFFRVLAMASNYAAKKQLKMHHEISVREIWV